MNKSDLEKQLLDYWDIHPEHSAYLTLRKRVLLLNDIGRLDGFWCHYDQCVQPSRSFGSKLSQVPVIDHVMPESLGGSDKPENWQLVHQGCNSAKARREDFEIRKERGLWKPKPPLKSKDELMRECLSGFAEVEETTRGGR